MTTDKNPLRMDDSDDPIKLFQAWLERARSSHPDDVTACSLASADRNARPSLRMVLLKSADDTGFVFYTNRSSRKGRQLAVNPWAALCFHWFEPYRQIRIEGEVRIVEAAVSDAYFASRNRSSRISSWASHQSQTMADPRQFTENIERMRERFADKDVARPPDWQGYRVLARRIEFWQRKTARRHERALFTRSKISTRSWQCRHLFP